MKNLFKFRTEQDDTQQANEAINNIELSPEEKAQLKNLLSQNPEVKTEINNYQDLAKIYTTLITQLRIANGTLKNPKITNLLQKLQPLQKIENLHYDHQHNQQGYHTTTPLTNQITKHKNTIQNYIGWHTNILKEDNNTTDDDI